MIISSLLTATIGLGMPVSPGIGMTFSSGGKDGNVILQAIHAADTDLQKTQTLGLRNRILTVLRTGLGQKYGIDNWNGYGAKAVNKDSVRYAELFVMGMPFGLEDPVVRVIPSGCVNFAWRAGKGRVCSVVVDADGKYHCASVIGASESAISTNTAADVYKKAMEVFG